MSNDLVTSATARFTTMLSEKVDWLCNDVWPSNIEHKLSEINKMIVAAKELGVSKEMTPISDDEVADLVKSLVPLRTLEMKEEARAIVLPMLKKHKLDRFYQPTQK